MKKLALILAFMLIPCTAFGLEMLNDDAMDSITGQSGVSIAFDDIQIFVNIEKLAWIDCDGFTSNGGLCSGEAGALALNNFQIDVLNINAILDGTFDEATNTWDLSSASCGQIPLFYDYASTVQAGCYLNATTTTGQTAGLNNYIATNTSSIDWDGYDLSADDGEGGISFEDIAAHNATVDFQAKALTIDATDELPALTEGIQNNDAAVEAAGATVGGVLIGIPTMEIYINSMTLTPVYDGDINGEESNAINDDNYVNLHGGTADFGTIYMQGITFTTLSGWLEIAPH